MSATGMSSREGFDNARGPLWAGARGIWSFFWAAAFAEIFALTEFGRGLFGDLGAEGNARAAKLHEVAVELAAEAAAALQAGNPATAETLKRRAPTAPRSGNC
jgi:glycine betaine/proline transport system permease protein